MEILPTKGYSRHYKLLKESKIYYPEIPEQQKIASWLFASRKFLAQKFLLPMNQFLKQGSVNYHLFYYSKQQQSQLCHNHLLVSPAYT